MACRNPIVAAPRYYFSENSIVTDNDEVILWTQKKKMEEPKKKKVLERQRKLEEEKDFHAERDQHEALKKISHQKKLDDLKEKKHYHEQKKKKVVVKRKKVDHQALLLQEEGRKTLDIITASQMRDIDGNVLKRRGKTLPLLIKKRGVAEEIYWDEEPTDEELQTEKELQQALKKVRHQERLDDIKEKQHSRKLQKQKEEAKREKVANDPASLSQKETKPIKKSEYHSVCGAILTRRGKAPPPPIKKLGMAAELNWDEKLTDEELKTEKELHQALKKVRHQESIDDIKEKHHSRKQKKQKGGAKREKVADVRARLSQKESKKSTDLNLETQICDVEGNSLKRCGKPLPPIIKRGVAEELEWKVELSDEELHAKKELEQILKKVCHQESLTDEEKRRNREMRRKMMDEEMKFKGRITKTKAEQFNEEFRVWMDKVNKAEQKRKEERKAAADLKLKEMRLKPKLPYPRQEYCDSYGNQLPCRGRYTKLPPIKPKGASEKELQQLPLQKFHPEKLDIKEKERQKDTKTALAEKTRKCTAELLMPYYRDLDYNRLGRRGVNPEIKQKLEACPPPFETFDFYNQWTKRTSGNTQINKTGAERLQETKDKVRFQREQEVVDTREKKTGFVRPYMKEDYCDTYGNPLCRFGTKQTSLTKETLQDRTPLPLLGDRKDPFQRVRTPAMDKYLTSLAQVVHAPSPYARGRRTVLATMG